MMHLHHRPSMLPTLQMPKFWRPKTPAATVSTVQIIHWDLIHMFTHGTAQKADLFDWLESGYTAAQLLRLLALDGRAFTDEAHTAIREVLAIHPAVEARFVRTGRVGFNAEELLIARAAASVMDSLLELDRHGIALQACMASVEQMRSVRARLAA